MMYIMYLSAHGISWVTFFNALVLQLTRDIVRKKQQLATMGLLLLHSCQFSPRRPPISSHMNLATCMTPAGYLMKYIPHLLG